MSTLQQIAQGNPRWSLEEFVAVTNDLLPQFLSPQEADSRVQDTVNPRLVRHYTTQGLLDKPLKQGREARYLYRHLLQMLVLRQLLARGYSAGSLIDLTVNKPDHELEALLGGAQLTVEATRSAPSNPALSFLSQVRDRTSLKRAVPPTVAAPPASTPPSTPLPSARSFSALPPAPAAAPSPASPLPSGPLPAPALQWTRVDLAPGLELHIRDDFSYPTNPSDQDALLQLIAQHLIDLSQRRPPP